MELKELRNQIDSIDDEIAKLFEKRTRIACDIAEYKRANGMEVFQGGREEEVLKRAVNGIPPELEDGARLLFTTLMDISKCRQRELLTESKPVISEPGKANPLVGAVTKGSYTADACEKFFGGNCRIKYFSDFASVFRAVEDEAIDYGVVPIENSTAGEVAATYDLMLRHRFHICKSTMIPINHVLAAKKGSKLSDIKVVMSHEMALKQCSRFLEDGGFAFSEASSTAKAAEAVAESADNSVAAVCSASCARLFGLEPVASDITDIKDNFTRFIMISRDLQIPKNADVVSLCITVPHVAGSLYRTLTRFAYRGLNLCRIESRPMPDWLAYLKDDAFEFIFYLDFIGSIRDENVMKLLTGLEREMKFYRFLGNYEEI
ncbi:MAG: chorismate mutase [Ruminiclostridium sp.]|nr:chorismate mutase [Ruminiclostridium sp.]